MTDEELRAFSWYRGNLLWLPERTIFLTKHGSHAYGTNVEGSDLDLKGIAVPPKAYFLGFTQKFEQAEMREPVDCVIYDIRKLFNLAADCNPNIIEVLFTDQSDWIIPDSTRFGNDSWYFTIWADIWHDRRLFLSQKAKHTFSGYAMAQIKRINTHRKWLLNPPKKKPERGDYDLPNNPTLAKDQLGVIEAKIRKAQDNIAGTGKTKDEIECLEAALVGAVVQELDVGQNLIPVILNERRYRSACAEWDQYQKWKEERNQKRSELEARFGYDTKHGMHLVRLMRMGEEILTTGEVIVKRPDREELIAIRNGAWSYDQLITYAYDMDAKLTEAQKTSKLPHSPDRQALDELLMNVVERCLYNTERLT